MKKIALSGALALALTACGGGSNDTNSPQGPQTQSSGQSGTGSSSGQQSTTGDNGTGTSTSQQAAVTIGGVLDATGVDGYFSIALSLNGAQALGVGGSSGSAVSGPFSLGTTLHDGDTYDVEISTQPIGFTKCAISNGSGTATANVTDISIVCGDATPQVSTLNAQFNTPTSVAVDSQGNVFVADPGANRVQKVASDGTVTTVYTGPDPDSVVVDSSDSLFVHDATTGMIYSFDSQGTQTTFVGPQTVLQNTGTLAPWPYGGVYFANYNDGTIVKYDPQGVATTIVTAGKLDHPVGLAYLYGKTLVAEAGAKNDIAAVFADGTVGLFSSNLSPSLVAPSGLTVGPEQKLFVVDGGANDLNWYSTGRPNAGGLLAGGVSGFADGNGAAARFLGPRCVVADRQGNLYVADSGNHVVRKITPVAPE
ncbi:NHL repeat-containing protein [Paraburkholderia metrosideri]|uniref:Virginiamycin B lyase n=1 Tax=Paraburkholderia metrosideri TaxID=580937 RepID=A0ABM8NHL9_9BURK|nr:hypothetical protein [Paraburkholderia metrosideri]CAD6525966.1 Virginiamycin B lyase [Paraburkholderia metrosideri]